MLAVQRFRIGIASFIVMLTAGTAAAQEQPQCGDEVKGYIVEALSKYDDLESQEAMSVQRGLYERFKYCAADAPVLKSSILLPRQNAYCGKLSAAGSMFFEQMRCCGYQPQQRVFACPIEVKQPFGFGPAPFPGSREHVLSCVDFGAGFVPVALDNVHLANAVSGAPIWNFAVVAKARGQLAEIPNSGRTFPARSILSWQFVPTDCSYSPIWGNAIDYQIRLDP